jgi:hypothetical protein
MNHAMPTPWSQVVGNSLQECIITDLGERIGIRMYYALFL